MMLIFMVFSHWWQYKHGLRITDQVKPTLGLWLEASGHTNPITWAPFYTAESP